MAQFTRWWAATLGRDISDLCSEVSSGVLIYELLEKLEGGSLPGLQSSRRSGDRGSPKNKFEILESWRVVLD